jgi:hypothetical protein
MTLRKASALLKIQAFSKAWKFGFDAYLESEVRDLRIEVRTTVSSACFGFPSASTPLPV